MKKLTIATTSALAALTGPAALAQDAAPARHRVRVIAAPAAVPAYPGADHLAISPYLDFSRVRGDTPFAFEAPDESTGFALYDGPVLSAGPVIGFENKRRRRDAGGLDEVGFSIELGGYIHAQVTRDIRLTAEARQGVSGHRGAIAMVGADYVARDGDAWLFSIGPRVTFADARYNRAYFGVGPAETLRTGVAAYRPRGGVQAVGATASMLKAIGGRWTLFGYAKYDRLVGDVADSPVTRAFGSRNQVQGGLGLGYTFGRATR